MEEETAELSRVQGREFKSRYPGEKPYNKINVLTQNAIELRPSEKYIKKARTKNKNKSKIMAYQINL